MPTRPCLNCGERERHAPPTPAFLPWEEALVPACPICGGPRDPHDRDRASCHACRLPKPGTLGATFVPLATNPKAGNRLATGAHAKSMARLRNLMTRGFNVPEEEWGRSYGDGAFRDAWNCLMVGLVDRGHAADRNAAYALPLTEVIAVLQKEAEALRLDPHRLPFDDAPAVDPPIEFPEVLMDDPGRNPAPVPAALEAPERDISGTEPPNGRLTLTARAIGAALDLKKEGLRVSLKAACKRAGVDRGHLRKRYPDAVKAIRAVSTPDRSPRRGTRDRRTGHIDGVDDSEE